MKHLLFIILCVFAFVSCDKAIDYTLDGPLPSTPEFSIDAVVDNPNKFLVTNNSTGNFSHVWSFPGGSPMTSTLMQDTVFYKKKGDYEITLHVSAEDGNGTALAKKSVSVDADVIGCTIPFLPEDCSEKCWRLSGDPGGVMVGPVPYSGEWYTSPDIVDTQADDRWCFREDGTVTYENNGSTFSACQGFVEDENYPIPVDPPYTFEEASGFDGLDVITLFEDLWMGIEDTGPTYNIISVTDTKMELLAPIKPCDGAPSNGWFTLTFYNAD